MPKPRRKNDRVFIPTHSRFRYIPIQPTHDRNRSVVRCKKSNRFSDSIESSYKNFHKSSSIVDDLIDRRDPPNFVFVWDLDETLAYFDESGKISKDPSYYLHPQARIWLKFCNRVKNSYTILWSHGRSDYVHDVIHHLKLDTYFDRILTHKHCNMSLEEFGILKSYEFLQSYINLPTTLKTKSILIDDIAIENSRYKALLPENTYSHIIQPPPFNANFILNFARGKVDKHYNFVLQNLYNFYILSLDLKIKNIDDE